MTCNLANGGLISCIDGRNVVTDLQEYTGTYLLEAGAEPVRLSEGLFWFMNVVEDCIYYSDQRKRNRLCSYSLVDHYERLVLDRPVYGLTYGCEKLFFIDEEDNGLYSCTDTGSGLTKLIAEPVNSFSLTRNIIWYATMNGKLKSYSIATERQSTIVETQVNNFVALDNKLVFLDTKQRDKLNIYENGNLTIVPELEALSINTDGRFLYCSNRRDECSIYRVDPNDASTIRICGEHADYLHIAEQELYFCNLDDQRSWYKVSLHGGSASKVTY